MEWLCDLVFGHGFWTPLGALVAGKGGCRRIEGGLRGSGQRLRECL